MHSQVFLRPFWLSFRALIGDIDISYVYDQLGDSYTPNQNYMGIAAVLIFYIYGFGTTVTIINLMIAQMSQSYDRISNISKNIRKYSRGKLCGDSGTRVHGYGHGAREVVAARAR